MDERTHSLHAEAQAADGNARGIAPSETDYAYMNGKFVPVDEAKISILNPAFLYGTAIFEGIRGYWLPETRQIAVFRLREHYERLLTNARMVYLTPQLGLDALCELTVDLIRRNRTESDLYIRPTLYTAGDHIEPILEKDPIDFCLWTRPIGAYLDLEKGLSVCVSNWRRVSDNAIPARAKISGAYMNTALAATDARRTGFDEAIFLTESGAVSEGSAMNLFLVKHGQLITPGRTEDILEGITRDTLMTLARNELGIETTERTIDRTELYGADEAFFCGTGAQVSPITRIDSRPLGDGRPGPITRKIQSLYFDVVKNRLPRYADWCTLVDIG